MGSKSKVPAAGRRTIEVDTSRLAQEARTAEDPVVDLSAKPRKRPPPLPGAAKNGPPPMPVPGQSARPSRRVTMEVKAEWLEEVAKASLVPPAPTKGARATATTPPPSKRRGRVSASPPVDGPPGRPQSRTSPPIPRED